MMVQKRSYRSEDEEKTDTSQIISEESTQSKAIYKLTPEMAGRSGLCTAGHEGEYEEVQFSVR